MSTSSNATSSSQDYSHTHITNILCVIRRANERYAQVAAALRHSLRPTYHARKRAQSLRLRVSIDLALKLDPKQISTVPLPIIEVVTPFPQEAPRIRPTLRCDIPQNVDQEGSLSSVSVYSKLSPDGLVSSTDLLASRWSLTTLGSDVGDQLPEEEITSSSDCDEVKGITIVGAQDTRRPVLCRSNDQDSVHLDVPIDANRFSWSSYLSDGLATDSSSSDSSGPETPVNISLLKTYPYADFFDRRAMNISS